MAIVLKTTDTELLEPGMHVVTIESMEFVPNPFEEGKEQLEIKLVSDEEKSIRFWASPSLHPKSKMYAFVEAVLGRKLNDTEKQEGFDVEDLISKKVCAIVKNATSSSGNEFTKVSDFMPVQA